MENIFFFLKNRPSEMAQCVKQYLPLRPEYLHSIPPPHGGRKDKHQKVVVLCPMPCNHTNSQEGIIKYKFKQNKKQKSYSFHICIYHLDINIMI